MTENYVKAPRTKSTDLFSKHVSVEFLKLKFLHKLPTWKLIPLKMNAEGRGKLSD